MEKQTTLSVREQLCLDNAVHNQRDNIKKQRPLFVDVNSRKAWVSSRHQGEEDCNRKALAATNTF